MNKYDNLSDDVIQHIKDVYNQKGFVVDVKMVFLHNEKQKKLIKISKPNDMYQFLLDTDLIVSVNEDIWTRFYNNDTEKDYTSINILIHQELDQYYIEPDSGRIKTTKPDLTTFSKLVERYGIEQVARANEVELLAVEQKADLDSEFIAQK